MKMVLKWSEVGCRKLEVGRLKKEWIGDLALLKDFLG